MSDFKFSKIEIIIIRELRKTKKGLSTSELSERVYKDIHKNDRPLNMNNSVTTTIRQINKKCKRQRFNWFVDGRGLGRNGKVLWLGTLK